MLYYLVNFERALAWLLERYPDLLSDDERAFIVDFGKLAVPSRALLVRMLMRRGTLFRVSRLRYDEIGCSVTAAAPLIEAGWVDATPGLSLAELFSLSTRPELLAAFPDIAPSKASRKADWYAALASAHEAPRSYAAWRAAAPDGDDVLAVTVAPLCDRLRLMFFGNLHQDWSEFVLADLGVFQYEQVPFSASSRAFQSRVDIDAYLTLHDCREALDAPGLFEDPHSLDRLSATVMALQTDNPWIESRRAKWLFRFGYACERQQLWDRALAAYERSTWPGARHRSIRVLERSARHTEALTRALEALNAPRNEMEHQCVTRMLPRLRRNTGLAPERPARAASVPRSVLHLPACADGPRVEFRVRDHLIEPDAPVHYVENTLINSLFGLLCWDAIFAALPGAFFHPFQRGPADLQSPDFAQRRTGLFSQCLAELEAGTYRDTILSRWRTKFGLQTPFVFWSALDETLLMTALECIPAIHLRRFFERLMQDVSTNRSGLPDLICFWPASVPSGRGTCGNAGSVSQRYEMIEVKGPGDRLQDNQIRWLEYCTRHRMPVRVLDVLWNNEIHAAADLV